MPCEHCGTELFTYPPSCPRCEVIVPVNLLREARMLIGILTKKSGTNDRIKAILDQHKRDYPERKAGG